MSPDGEWTTYTLDGLSVHVDSAIVPPECWVISVVERHRLVAQWEGHNPDLFGRLPLDTLHGETSEPLQSSPTTHVKAFLVVPALAWVFAALWALRYFGVRSDWAWTAQAAVAALLAGIAVVTRWWESSPGGGRTELPKRTPIADASSGHVG